MTPLGRWVWIALLAALFAALMGLGVSLRGQQSQLAQENTALKARLSELESGQEQLSSDLTAAKDQLSTGVRDVTSKLTEAVGDLKGEMNTLGVSLGGMLVRQDERLKSETPKSAQTSLASEKTSTNKETPCGALMPG